MAQRLTLTRPDDWHLHLRDGAVLAAVAPQSRHFGRAIIMPNLVPPVTTTKEAHAYRQRIQAALPDGGVTPLMTLYLTETTQADDVAAGASDGVVTAVKLYPAGATTNSASGVRNLDKVMPVLERMAQIGLPLCIHGEVTDPDVDIFDREAVFIDTKLAPLRARLPELKITLEHVTTADGIAYIESAPHNLAGSLTPHHLMISRNDLLVGGIRPHYYCLPIVKRSTHRDALRRAATSGDPRFFLGTDSAPHLDGAKESACGCAGVFLAPNTLACLAHVFEEDGVLDRLDGFAGKHGPAWYGLPPNTDTITLIKDDTPVAYPSKIQTDEGPITVFDPGHPLFWRVEE
ncbi:MAG: dihydroorotase [Pseudomonadota bacterium]